MNVSLRALRYVVATADFGNLTEAAKFLNVSQPSISAAVAQFEAECGVQIFVRHHAKGVTTTIAGTRIINEARLLLNHARDFGQNARAMADEVRGEITVGCFWTLATHFMPSLLSDFAENHPGISVSLDEGDQAQILDAIISGRTELAFSYEFAVPEEVVAEPLAELPPYVVLHPDHPLAQRDNVRLVDLKDEPFILLDLPHSRDYFLGLFRSVGIEPKIAFRSKAYELTRGLVGHGRGYTIQNVMPRTQTTHDGCRVAAVPLVERLEPVHLVSLRLRRQAPRPAVEVFARHLKESFSASGVFAPGTLSPRVTIR
ncbi:LysR family transcriptional regulator [Ancylobacter defluvii]|uniref:Transcriptional regulator n=1 Tax=Ancylobacter defluvii TaxID=1282440 RepID=A0A9W6JYY3_9HYPH|nr:LysR family transcriptional regulator [Ancylobacter defluvii]MBS7589436.1 LysR family transcriptional regulator [Ancylobacter defluvii]GLK85053.1 transcriptional regulator [Ancylobacter defluvii]